MYSYLCSYCNTRVFVKRSELVITIECSFTGESRPACSTCKVLYGENDNVEVEVIEEDDDLELQDRFNKGMTRIGRANSVKDQYVSE